MDPYADPAEDRQEFADRLQMYIDRFKRGNRESLVMALAEGDLLEQASLINSINAYKAWRDDMLDQWDNADQSGRESLVGGLAVDSDQIVKDYSPMP